MTVRYEDLHRDDVYLWDGDRCTYMGDSSWMSDSSGRKSDVKIFLWKQGEDSSVQVPLDWTDLKCVFDHRVRVGDMVDVYLADERTIRGMVMEIVPSAERPYLVEGPDGSVWFAAWEFERFLRADHRERAVVSLIAVRERIRVLEVELEALRLSEEVLEGVYT